MFAAGKTGRETPALTVPIFKRVLVKGAGEQASGTAHRLFRCGYEVVMTELARPTARRRRVSFCSAVYDGHIEVEGVQAVGYRLADAGMLHDFDFRYIPVFVDPEATLRKIWHPDIIVDARLAKRNLDNSLRDAPLVIGLGPGLEGGRDVHVVIETDRGHDLGRAIRHGFAAPNTGVPGTIAGRGAERLLRAPATGELVAWREIGDHIAAGEQVGRVNGCHIVAGIEGVLRGLVHAGLQVTVGQKLGDIDPRDDQAFCDTLSDKARTISGSVLETILAEERGRR